MTGLYPQPGRNSYEQVYLRITHTLSQTSMLPPQRRASALLALVAATATCLAQQAPDPHFFQATEPVERAVLKTVMEALNDQAPGTRVFLSDDATVLKILPAASFDAQAARAAIQQAGVALLPGTPDVTTLVAPPTATDAPPVYVATGDHASDAQRYVSAVQQWNLAHPDQRVELPDHLLAQ